MRQLTIGANDCNQRIDKFLAKRFRNMPNALIYKFIRKKCVLVNRKKVTERYILQEGDVLSFFISDEFFGEEREKKPYESIKPQVCIAYEDENILIADKPAGLIVHADDREQYNTLINHIQAYLFQKGEFHPERENYFAPALCNRIDRNTQGLVIAAKNAKSLAEMNEIIKRRLLEKRYLAVVHGKPTEPDGTLRTRLEKDQKTNTVHQSAKYGKEAVTKYHVLAYNRDKQLSLLEIELLTGRTHQIRAQFASIGHPLLGDGKYAVNKADRAMGYAYQALCSYSLRFFPGKECPTEDFPLLSYLRGLTVRANSPAFLQLFPQYGKSTSK